jgi:hypothetical protein
VTLDWIAERGIVLMVAPIDTENRPSLNLLDTLPGPHDDIGCG